MNEVNQIPKINLHTVFFVQRLGICAPPAGPALVHPRLQKIKSKYIESIKRNASW